MEDKTYWITDDRFKFIAILLVVIFLIFMTVVFIQGENISRNPCSLCAKKMGETVHCTVSSGTMWLTKDFEPNGTVNNK